MDKLIAKQEARYERLFKAYSNYKKTPKDRITVSYIESRLESLEKLWEDYFEEHLNVYSAATAENKTSYDYFVQDKITIVEEIYTEYKAKLKEDLRARKTSSSGIGGSSSSPQVNPSCEVRLPQIQLPSFSGAYDEWQTFYDMFGSLIHNNPNLSAVQKLHYLKSSLKGEPEILLKNLSTTENNYEEAWNKLQKRYNNKRYNSNEILKRLFSQRNISTESASAIKQLLDTTSSCLKSLKNLGIQIDTWDAIIIYLVASKLDYESRRQWETEICHSDSNDLPTWDQLVKFLEMRFRSLEMFDGIKISKPTQHTNTKQLPKHKSFHSAVQEENKEKIRVCTLCSNQHLLHQCKQFGGKTPQERSDLVQSKGLCYNCLSPNHSVRGCHQTTCCRRCGRRHHTLLHYERSMYQGATESVPTNPEKPSSLESTQEKTVVAHFTKEGHQPEVLLATALVKVKATNGYSQIVRVLVDQGSEASFISENTVQSLGLKRVPVNGTISGVGNGQSRTKSMVAFDLESLHNTEFCIRVNAFVLSSLTSFLPSNKTSIMNWPDILNLPLADPNYGLPGKIDIILGVNVHSEILLEGLLRHPTQSGPIAQNTELGWVLSGKVSNLESSEPRIINLHLQVKEEQLLKQFWEIEREPDMIRKRLTKDETRCEEIYERTTVRNDEGRYVVRLPFKESDPSGNYGKTKEIALRRHQLLQRKLEKRPLLHKEYTEVLQDYINQNHMEKIERKEEIDNPNAVYLPHHSVERVDKETTKLRVVFDASCKGVNNVSLNDTLLVGSNLQQDLRHILMRWRTHPFCIIADIKQMYRQVVVNPEDTDFQRILWRSQPDKPVEHFRLLRLTFGTACAPFLAVKSLQQLAHDEHSKYPIAANIAMEDYCMDDLLTGCEDENEAVEIYEQMTKLMNEGGFHLRKWCSNSQLLMDHIQREKQGSEEQFVFKANDMLKVLGLSWNKVSDQFQYTYNLPERDTPITKRKVLSDIARLYDPMGWIAPVILIAKIFIQRLWKAGLDWDESLPSDLLAEWLNFRRELNKVNLITIPRWLDTFRDDEWELHVFADASQKAYAAVLYLKSIHANCVNVKLLTAKTKVAPVEKEISIPRMELCAALLAAKLIHEVSQIMKIPNDKLFAWSDSTVVLAWLRGEPSRRTTFVSNRISEILTMLDSDKWRHVGTDQNPADCASRGTPVVELFEHHLWWNGPDFLRQQNHFSGDPEFRTNKEERPVKSLVAAIKNKEEFIWTKFSSLPRLLRVLSYCRRFLQLILPKEQRLLTTVVSTEEMNKALQICVKLTRELHFAVEIKQLKSLGHVPKRSSLHTLCPFLDENGILRVSGRINQCEAEFDKKHPIVIPSDSHITRLIIADAHRKTLHGGPLLMMNVLRSKYWIIRARERVKKYYRECVICTRYSRQNNNQLMGQLPKARLTPDKPFRSSGVDFTGFINIRFSPGRGSKSYKGYVCLFICMVTRAIHLEAVSDLTATGFIAAFRRFVSRRGSCHDLYSDNGTNFVGAESQLREMLIRSKTQLPNEISQMLSNEGTTWHFIPPHAPNFGGLWEAGVRSTKAHLKRIIGDATLTFEELSTVLTQIEACLNSRPISVLSDNPDDPLPLTPGHFLVGEPLVVIPDENFQDIQRMSGLQRWKLTQKMINDFWRKWSDEYLVNLNQRQKWTVRKLEPEIDDIVIIRESNIPPAKWLLGRVIEKHPGKDNITRVVTVKTKNGSFKRPCNKLCLLPKSDDYE